MRRASVVGVAFSLVSALLLGLGGLAAAPSDDHEAGFVTRIGDERAAAGLSGYVVAPDLVDVARRHADEMRRQQRLHHNPKLGDEVQGWQAVGENVGVGPSVEEIHQKLMASPSHRDNILSGRYTEVGVGVVVDGADLWVVQVFRLPQSSSSPPSEPAPPSEPSSSRPEPAPEPRPEPRPTPAPAPAPAPAGGTVRAANASSGAGPTVPPATSSPAPPTTSSPTPPSTSGPVESAASPLGTTATPAAGVPLPEQVTTPDTPTSTASLGERFGAASDRNVTWPVALAATMLLGVVIALAVHVGGAGLRSGAGVRRRTSLLDVWELAVAR